MTVTLPKRFVNFHDGRGTMDTQMDPKTLRAQEAFAKQGRVARPKTKGFSQPSEHDMRVAKEES